MLKIDDKDHLHILMTVFFDAKYSPDPVTPELQASPVVNLMYQQVIDAAKEVFSKQYRAHRVNKIDNWLQSTRTNGYILPSVKARIARLVDAPDWLDSGWSNLSEEERRAQIEQHITPFCFDDELIDSLIAYGDSLLTEKAER